MQDHEYHFGKRPTRTYVSRRFGTMNGDMRTTSRVIEAAEGLMDVKVKDELIVRRTPAGREEIKATFYEDSRQITTLTIQKFLSVGGPHQKQYFTFTGKEIDDLLRFVASVKRIRAPDEGKFHIDNAELEAIIMEPLRARGLFEDNEELFSQIIMNASLKRDLVALGYRRRQLEYFERLLQDDDFFNTEVTTYGGRGEALWQAFFEANRWIFGVGLSYVSLDGLDDKKLEQITSGRDLSGAGKRTDALMKTNALISSLCFVEIKKHDTDLLGKPYRPEVWSPSPELAGGVAQVQVTVQSTIERLTRKYLPTDDLSNPTGEELFLIAPKSFLVIGSLTEFQSFHGVNEAKFRAFELFRRNLHRPEVITFDELLHRARFIVEHYQDSGPLGP